MTPDIPILNRRLQRSFLSDSYYSPHFLIASNSHRLRPLDTRDLADSLEFHLTHIHEGIHWFQHIGTTFGTFMEALRSSQRNSLLRFMRDEPRAKRAEILSARMDHNRPLIEFDPGGRYFTYTGEDLNSNIEVLRQIWFDHQWLHAQLEDSRSTDGLGHIPIEACGAVVADVILDCCDTYGFLSHDYRAADHRGAREWYFAEDSILSDVLIKFKDGHQHLTSIGLMECSASLNEIQQIGSDLFAAVLGAQHQVYKNNRIEVFLNSSYSLPLKVFTLTAPKHILDHRIGFIALNLVIYFALNPPLPPRVLSMPSRPYRWSEIYPPHRFVAALRALRDVSALEDPHSIKAMHKFLDELTQASSLPYAGEDLMPDRVPPEPSWEVCSETCDYPWIISDQLIIEAQFQIEKIANRLPLLASYSSCVLGPLSLEFSDLLLKHDERFNFMRPPLEFALDGDIGFTGTRVFGNNVVRSVAASHALFEFACGTGVMTLDQLPDKVRTSQAILNLMRRSLHHMIVETDNK